MKGCLILREDLLDTNYSENTVLFHKLKENGAPIKGEFAPSLDVEYSWTLDVDPISGDIFVTWRKA